MTPLLLFITTTALIAAALFILMLRSDNGNDMAMDIFLTVCSAVLFAAAITINVGFQIKAALI